MIVLFVGCCYFSCCLTPGLKHIAGTKCNHWIISGKITYTGLFNSKCVHHFLLLIVVLVDYSLILLQRLLWSENWNLVCLVRQI